jgi:pyruvate-formate lyase-activating enzyme
MKVLLSTSPHVRHAAVLQSDFAPSATLMYTFAPVGLLSLIATLQRDRPHIACRLYDLNRKIISNTFPLDHTFYEAVAVDLCSSTPDVIGFMTECDSYHHLLQIAIAIKRILPQCFVIFGGPHASAVARPTLAKCAAIDAIVVGEGEATFPELLDEIESEGDGPVPGAIMRRARHSDIIDGGPRALLDSLDELPMPAYELYQADTAEEIFVEVGRGCPFQCQFCSTAPFWGRKHRVKSASRIVSEVQLVRRLFGATRVHFTHDLFTTKREWVKDVCETLIRADVPIRWTCSARTDTVDESLLALMARAGCNAIYFGVESGSERILREIRKDIPLEQSFRVFQICREVGITANAGFIAGFPTEDTQSLRETLNAFERALRAGCRPTHLFGYCPFASSAMYAQLTKLECGGHFVDMPLGLQTDLENRRRIAGDRDLYGAYFRPILPDIIPGERDAVPAVDEFSPLVEAVLIPTLALSECLGGMYEVYRTWLRWIHRYNDARAAPHYRRGYGTVATFATFVLDELRSFPEAPRGVLAVAEAVQMNLLIAESSSLRGGVTMATYRSLILPVLDQEPEITLNTRLSRGAIAGCLALAYDVTPAFRGEIEFAPVEDPTYLVWQRISEHAVRLLRVDAVIFDALQSLDDGVQTVGQLIVGRFTSETWNRAPGALDPSGMVASLSSAAAEGLITIGTDGTANP